MHHAHRHPDSSLECEPEYLTNTRADNVYDVFTREGSVLKSEAELKFETRVKDEQLSLEFRRLAQGHPELAQAMLELDAKKQSLAEREQRMREERGFFGRLFEENVGE